MNGICDFPVFIGGEVKEGVALGGGIYTRKIDFGSKRSGQFVDFLSANDKDLFFIGKRGGLAEGFFERGSDDGPFNAQVRVP
ncbi:hypothetical protein D9M68_984020 [compost metagenome]